MNFDKKKIDIISVGRPYKVVYHLLESNLPAAEIDHKCLKGHKYVSNTNKACFAQLSRQPWDGIPKANRIYFECDLNQKKDKRLSEDEIHEWIGLCQAEGILPVVNGDFFENKGVCLSMEDVSPDRLYLQLCYLRHVQESPWFIRAVLHMVNDLGMGFYTAMTPASLFCMDNPGHHFLNIYRAYGLNWEGIEEMKNIDLKNSKKLYKFVNTSKKDDEKTKAVRGFNIHNMIAIIKVAPLTVNMNELAHKKTEKQVRS